MDWESVDGSSSGPVLPQLDCPHISRNFRLPTVNSGEELDLTDEKALDTNSPCSSCSENQQDDENWICLFCYKVGCSRWRKGHAVSHYKESRHCIALSLSDLSVWCYDCDAYILHPDLEKIIAMAHLNKHGFAILHSN